jgi:hypothetical protein
MSETAFTLLWRIFLPVPSIVPWGSVRLAPLKKPSDA